MCHYTVCQKNKQKHFCYNYVKLPPKSDNFYPLDAMLARVIAIAMCLSICLSVRPFVCPSVTSQYCVKTKKASGMISSPPGSPKTLVF